MDEGGMARGGKGTLHKILTRSTSAKLHVLQVLSLTQSYVRTYAGT